MKRPIFIQRLLYEPFTARRIARVLGHAVAGAGLILVFVSGSLLAFVMYANLPAGRRVVGFALQRVLGTTFQGRFTIETINRVSLTELRASGITVQDPEGRLVLSVSELSVQADFTSIVRQALLGTGAVTLRFDHARLERAEVFLLPGLESNVPTIVEAFTPVPSAPGTANASSGGPLKVWFPEIEVGHIYGRMALDGVPTLETDLSAVRGSVVGSAALTTVDVDRFSALVRGVGGTDATGVGSVHVRAPGAVWTSFDGYFGDLQLGTVVRVDGPKLDITLDVPKAEPQAARALWAAYPLLQNVGGHVEAVGTLQSLHTQAKLSLGTGSVASSGELRLSGHPGADLDLSARSVDLRALWPQAPQTDLDADSQLTVFQSGNQWVANVTGTTRATRVLDVPVPPIDVTGSYDSGGFVGHATVHEPGATIKAAFDVHPDGSIDASAEASHVDLSRAPRLRPYFDGHGLLDVQLKARVEKNRLVAQFNGDLAQFSYGQVTVQANHFSGRATGPLNAPEKLALDFSVASRRFRAGAFGFDDLKTKVSGLVTRPTVSTTLTNEHGPVVTATAKVTPRSKPLLDDVSLEVRRGETVLSAQVKRVSIDGDRVRVDGLSMDGAGGKLEGSGQLSPNSVALAAHGSDLDLALITHTLGLPRGALGGKFTLNADLESTRKTQRGTIEAHLEQGEAGGVAIDTAALFAQLQGSQLALQTTAKLRDFGVFGATAQATMPGSLAQASSYEHATGTLSVKAEHVPFALLSYVLPKSVGVSDVRGEGSATLVLDRTDPNVLPNVSLVAGTQGLHVGLEPRDKTAKAKAFDVEAHAGMSVNGRSGETDVTLKLDDAHGTLASATTHLTIDLTAAMKHPELLLQQLRATPLVAKAVVEDRSLSDLPAPIAPEGIAARLRAEVSVRGSVDRPIFSGKTELYQLRLGDSDVDRAIDVCAQLDYDKSTGQYGGRGEAFLPTENARACKGSRVAQFSAGGRAEWEKLTSPAASADPAWTGTAGLQLEGLPLDVVPVLAESGFGGRVQGVVMFDRRDALPLVRASFQVQDAIVARTRLGVADVNAQTDGRSLSANLSIARLATGPTGVGVQGGQLKASLQSSIDWEGVVPGLDETRPISGKISAKNLDAVILAPFLRDVLSEIGGKLDADLEATLTPELSGKAEQPFTGAVKGSLAMRDGNLQLARLAVRLHDVKFDARAEPLGNTTLITVDSLSAAADADRSYISARGNLSLAGFRVTRGTANVTVRDVPLQVEGVTLATLTDVNLRQPVVIELERRPTEMFVGLMIPELEAKLPQAAARSLIDLSNNESVRIAQPIAEPQLGANGESLPWRMKFDLGRKVKVTRADVFLPISGSPQILLGEELKILGNIELANGGRLSLPGLPRPFTIENGTVFFDPDDDPKNPRLRVRAVCRLAQLTVWATVTGTFQNAEIVFESDDPNVKSQAQIEAALLSAPTDGNASAASLGAGAGYLSKQLIANSFLSTTALSNLEIKAGNETTADQRSYATYSAAYPITDEIWFEGSYKAVQAQDLSGANRNAFSGTLDWRFRRNWSLRGELGTIGAGVDLLWQYRY